MKNFIILGNFKRSNSMYKIMISLIFSISLLMSKSFTISDPPMIYIYHFVSYDTTDVLLHGGNENQSQNKKVRLPLFNKSNLEVGQNVIVGKPLDPKLVSAMVTSAVAENNHINIAGESIQNRIKTDNFIKLVKSSDYPKRTDYIFIGEINTIASQYEIDLKLIDVSTQKIVASESFNTPFASLANLRNQIDSVVKPLMHKIINPFTGHAFLRVDSTSREKIRWDAISIRPVKTVVGSNTTNTSNSDYETFLALDMPINFMQTHGKVLSKYLPVDYKIISDLYGSPIFLQGEYRLRAYLKNNEKPFETSFTIEAGNLNEIHMALSYTPPPIDSDGDGISDGEDGCIDIPGEYNADPKKNGCPPPELFGNIVIKNIWDGVGFELIKLGDDLDTLILYGKKYDGELEIDSKPYKINKNKDNSSFTIMNLPLGNYVRNSWAITEEKFPGKHYLNLFSETDSLNVDKGEVTLNTSIKSSKITTGREIVIYFNPFTPDKLDEYILFIGDEIIPQTKASIAGELHIVGFPTNYEGMLYIKREGYKKAEINISSGTQKSYHLANVSVQSEDKKENQKKFGSFLK